MPGQGMHTDTAVLAAESANFERIAGELKAIMAQVEATAAGLQPSWHGSSATAGQAALLRFHEAAQAQNRELEDISQNIQISGTQYTSSDEDQAHALANAMVPPHS